MAEKQGRWTRCNTQFAEKPCRCKCGCQEHLAVEEAKFGKGLCLACFGGFHGLQATLRAARRL